MPSHSRELAGGTAQDATTQSCCNNISFHDARCGGASVHAPRGTWEFDKAEWFFFANLKSTDAVLLVQITYEYVKLRKEFGRHPTFRDFPAEVSWNDLYMRGLRGWPGGSPGTRGEECGAQLALLHTLRRQRSLFSQKMR